MKARRSSDAPQGLVPATTDGDLFVVSANRLLTDHEVGSSWKIDELLARTGDRWKRRRLCARGMASIATTFSICSGG
jgi:hypothetical protein